MIDFHAPRFEIYAKHNTLVLPEYLAVDFVPDAGSVLIRIKGDGFEPLDEIRYDAVLRVMFGDTENKQDGNTPISLAQAKQMITFMDLHRGKRLVVHCMAGISRSSATAKAWAYLNGQSNLMIAIDRCRCFQPNRLVFNMLKDEIDRRERLGL